VLTLGRRVSETSEIVGLVLPYMRELSMRTNLTCHLAILGETEAVHLEKVVARRHLNGDNTKAIGDCSPLHSSSLGKALLAWQSKESRASLLGKLKLQKYSSTTITGRDRVIAELNKIQERGFSLDDQETSIGRRCVGSVILDPLGNAKVALSLSGRASEITDSRVQGFANELMETAHKISLHFERERIELSLIRNVQRE